MNALSFLNRSSQCLRRRSTMQMRLNVRKPLRAGAQQPARPVRAVAARAAATEQKAVSKEVVDKCINAIRFLSIDAVNKANSGHPGAPMGCAPMSYVIWNEFMRFNPKNPKWINRDRFVLSIGHASMLQYSMLYLCGFDSVTVRRSFDILRFVLVLNHVGFLCVCCSSQRCCGSSRGMAHTVCRRLRCRLIVIARAEYTDILYHMDVHAHTFDVLVQMDDIKQFRQYGSATPGHPENFVTAGIEVTTGVCRVLDAPHVRCTWRNAFVDCHS